MPHRVSPSPVMSPATLAAYRFKMSQQQVVAQALTMARESDDEVLDPVVFEILDNALRQTWAKVMARPSTYIMTRDEFSLFNFYQHLFVGNPVAVAARKRYWDNASA
ncbi:hypothetical protein CP532_6083 [Ophiocordyceps camponoti-leonardi (nom. inval.)]|nr:hypothetical protein CP532_6083 [Ophiocordyceps camponoti-leonardi (nom. inval.)]